MEVMDTFSDFLNHELISINPYSLSDDEIMAGIRSRSNNKPEHRCEMLNRMNRYCTLVTIVGHRNQYALYTNADYGVFKYAYNENVEFELLYSVFKYPHSFCDFGLVRDSFGGNDKIIYSTFDIINGDFRSIGYLTPNTLFEDASNYGAHIFLEYSLEGMSKFNSIKELPSFVNIDENDVLFIKEIKKSLLKTKYVLLSLIAKYPRHLMHMGSYEFMAKNSIAQVFDKLYDEKIKTSLNSLLQETQQELVKNGLSKDLPF